MKGAPLLAAVGVVAVLGFALQRARSPFLRIEADEEVAAEIAARVGLQTVDVMALRELLGVGLERDELVAQAERFVADRRALGGSDALAAVAASGHRGLAVRLFENAGGSATQAEADLRPLPEAIAAVRFRTVRERFSSRRED